MTLPRRTPLGALALAVLAGMAGGAPSPVVQGEGGARDLLGESLAAESFEPQALQARLGALGRDSVSELFEVLCEGSVFHDAQTWPLDRGHELVVLGALARLPADVLRAFLETLVNQGADEGRRTTALTVLARCGTTADLPLAGRVAPSSPEQIIVEREVRAAFARTCDTLLRREPGSLKRLADLVPRVHLSLVPVLLERIASDRSPRRGHLLVGLLGKVKEADPLVLTELERLTTASSLELTSADKRLLRSYLWGNDPTLLRCAIRVLVAARDEETVEELVDFLDNPDDNLRRAAHDGLVALCRVDLGWERESWASWLAAELSWWERGAQRCRDTVADGPATLAIQAIRVIGHRQLYPGRAVELLQPGLERDEAEVVALTCKVLGSMGSTRALPALLERTEHENAAVRAEAFEALRKITKQSFPDDPSMWKRKLSPQQTEDSTHER